MTWAEFQIRSIGLKRVWQREEKLFREVAYQAHCALYSFSKTKPPRKEKFWPIGEPKRARVTPKMRAAFLAAKEKYKREKAEKSGAT